MRRYCVLVHLGTATPPRRQPPLTKLVACAKPPIQRRSEPSGPVSPDKDSRDQATRKEATQDSNAEDSHLAPPRRSLLVRPAGPTACSGRTTLAKPTGRIWRRTSWQPVRQPASPS